jgi:serine/threonine protein kinase
VEPPGLEDLPDESVFDFEPTDAEAPDLLRGSIFDMPPEQVDLENAAEEPGPVWIDEGRLDSPTPADDASSSPSGLPDALQDPHEPLPDLTRGRVEIAAEDETSSFESLPQPFETETPEEQEGIEPVGGDRLAEHGVGIDVDRPEETRRQDETRAAGAADRYLGRYRLEKRVAVGEMSELWQARTVGVEGSEKLVGVRRILPQLVENEEFASILLEEAHHAALLNHGNLVDILDVGRIGESVFVAMECTDGWDLRSVLDRLHDRGETFPLDLALFIGARVASALDYSHGRSGEDDEPFDLVHRQVSPQTVLISRSGRVRLCDFGVARAFSALSDTDLKALGDVISYLSPEQARGDDLDGRSDLFSLGTVLFEMVTGRPLFAEESDLSLIDVVRKGEVDKRWSAPGDLPENLELILQRSVSESPEDRYQTAFEMLGDLEEALFRLEQKPTQSSLAAWLEEVFSESGDEVAMPVTLEEASPGTEPDEGRSPHALLWPLRYRASLHSWLSSRRLRFWLGVAAGLLVAAMIGLGIGTWLDLW